MCEFCNVWVCVCVGFVMCRRRPDKGDVEYWWNVTDGENLLLLLLLLLLLFTSVEFSLGGSIPYISNK